MNGLKDLPPCPRCGHTPLFHKFGEVFQVECTTRDCGVVGGAGLTPREALEAYIESVDDYVADWLTKK
jgi:uncharacterized Zn finger protein (UPF0148 family)